jgi:altronate dehydratase small subunit
MVSGVQSLAGSSISHFGYDKEDGMAREVWVIDPKDNVGTVISHAVKRGVTVKVEGHGRNFEVTAQSDIPYGHKVALVPIRKGETVWKYGLSIGRATADLRPGEHVHIHNIESQRGRGDLHAAKKIPLTSLLPSRGEGQGEG